MIGKIALSLLAITAGILILSKTFIYPDCYSFDSHDDANHAFPNNYVARQAIYEGEIPTINYFNNFGSPILGDALTYPFGIQSITYFFVDGPLGMTINRFLIAILTIISAFYFFRIYLGVFSSLVCALLILFNPVSFWYPVHQYQMATPLFFISIFLINKLITTRLVKYLVFLSMLFVILVLSVSINLVLFMVPFFIAWSFCRNNFRLNRYFWAPLIAFAAGVVFFYPQTYDFIRNYLTSARVDEGVYSGILPTLRDLFLGIAIPPGEWIYSNYGAHFQVISYISIPVILIVMSGIWIIRRESLWKQISLFLCGIIPTVLAFILYINTELRFSIPMVKSVDVLRILWFSMPFCFVYLGYFLTSANEEKINRSISILIIIGSLLSVISFKLIPELSDINALHFVTILLLLFAALMYMFKNKSHIAFISLLISLLLVPLPTIIRILGLNTKSCGGSQYFTEISLSKFAPYSLVHYMKRGNRTASEIHTSMGHDLRIAQDGLLGSDARGITIDKNFGKYLEEKKLVFVDQIPYGYYFIRPWQTEMLTKLGIRYLVIRNTVDTELENENWKKLAAVNNYSLYENPYKPTPIYLLREDSEKPNFVTDYNFFGNHITANLHNISPHTNLVVTILNRYGFVAEVDGKPRDIDRLDNGFISLKVFPGEKRVLIRHSPYPWVSVYSGMGLSIFLILFYSLFFTKRRDH